ncbi:MAG TPA: methionyl-tRNA formyltransferase [Vicinamibacterales bacterium]|jgi:methionyl-tRNA formyltransferase|nr:methionyl-tRNA formyltransferase [Vicinamibacterales bacterium]
MVVVYFGTPQFAVPTLRALLGSRHRVCGIVTQPDRPRGRGQKITDAPVKALAVARGVPVIQPDSLRDATVADTLTRWAPDIGVVAAYGKIIPESLLRIPRFGMVNVHASLLPKYRGAAPVHRAVIDGEPETGVTIMRVERLLDSGDMFATVTRPIGPDETSDHVERELADLGATLLLQVLDAIEAGTAQEEKQDHATATYASKIARSEGVIDWTLPAISIHNRVRGLYPWPHAFTYLDRSRIIVLKTRVEAEITTAAPGTIVAVSRDELHVATGHGGRLAIEELQPEGRRPMRVREYLAGRPIQPGVRFSGPPETSTATEAGNGGPNVTSA